MPVGDADASIVIPALNATAYLPGLREAFERQTVRPREILLIDSASDDGTPEAARALGWRVLPIAKSDFDHGGTRNLGVAETRGDVVVFLSQDALPVTDAWLEELLRPLHDGAASASFSRQLPREGASYVEAFARRHAYPSEPRTICREDVATLGLRAYFFSNASSAVLREAFEEVGGFRADLIMNEDMMLAASLIARGRCTHYAAASVVAHSHAYRFDEQLRRNFDIAVALSQADDLVGDTPPGKEGAGFVRRLFAEVVRERRFGAAPSAAADVAARATGHALGRLEPWLPVRAKRRLSMNRGHWERPPRS